MHGAAGRIVLATGGLLVALAASGQGVPPLQIDDRAMHCPAPLDAASQACAAALVRSVHAQAQEAFIVQGGLRASDAEVAELVAYDEAFSAHDRSQRARKLDELDARIAASAEGTERERLERFRAVLVRLARYEADVDAGREVRMMVPRDTLRRIVELAKLNVALHARYGGVVGIEAAGPYPHAARIALVEDYLRMRRVTFSDETLRERFYIALNAPPRLRFKGTVPDFTPYWRRPIPASYVVD